MGTIEIPYEYGAAAFGMKETLPLIEPLAAALDWYVVEFEPSSMVGEGGNRELAPPRWVSALRHEIEQSEQPLRIEWQTLKAFSSYVGHTDNALLIGLRPGQSLPCEPIDLNSPDLVIVLQAVDSTLWAITSEQRELLEVLHEHFKDAKMVSGTSRYY